MLMKTTPQGLRYSRGKPRYDLIPPDFLEALAEHYRRGAEKYTIDLGEGPSEETLAQYEGREIKELDGHVLVLGDNNWKLGMSWGECYRALLSHANKWAMGESIDPETGSHHMVAVAWNAIAIFYYETHKMNGDFRK